MYVSHPIKRTSGLCWFALCCFYKKNHCGHYGINQSILWLFHWYLSKSVNRTFQLPLNNQQNTTKNYASKALLVSNIKHISLDGYSSNIISQFNFLTSHSTSHLYIWNRSTLHSGPVDRSSTNVSENYVPRDGRGHGNSLAERISRLREHNGRDRVSAVYHVVY